MKSRAQRRLDLGRMKRRARAIYPNDSKAGWANHVQGCSCLACGNPRRHTGEPTLQERRALEAFRSTEADYGWCSGCRERCGE